MIGSYGSCPDDYEVRRGARRDAESDQRRGFSPRRHPYDCDEANDTYRRVYRDEHRVQEDRAAEEARFEREEEDARGRERDQQRRQEEYWAQEQREEEEYLAREREAEEEALAADEEEASDGDGGVIF